MALQDAIPHKAPPPFPLTRWDHANWSLVLLPCPLMGILVAGINGARRFVLEQGRGALEERFAAPVVVLHHVIEHGGGVCWRWKTLLLILAASLHGGSAEAALTSSGSWPWAAAARQQHR